MAAGVAKPAKYEVDGPSEDGKGAGEAETDSASAPAKVVGIIEGGSGGCIDESGATGRGGGVAPTGRLVGMGVGTMEV